MNEYASTVDYYVDGFENVANAADEVMNEILVEDAILLNDYEKSLVSKFVNLDDSYDEFLVEA